MPDRQYDSGAFNDAYALASAGETLALESVGGIDFGASWGGGLVDYVTRLGANTWAQKTLMQQNQEGQRYIEGQALAQRQVVAGNNNGLILLVGAGLVLFMLAKD